MARTKLTHRIYRTPMKMQLPSILLANTDMPPRTGGIKRKQCEEDECESAGSEGPPSCPKSLGIESRSTWDDMGGVPDIRRSISRSISSLLDPQTFRHWRAVCKAWASSNNEDFWKVHCIAAYPLTEEVKKLMPSSDWQRLYRQHRISEGISMDDAKRILQDTELAQGSGERFDRADLRVGIRIYIADGPQMKVLLEVLLKLNDKPTNDALVDYDFKDTERCTYEIACEEYLEMKLRVWLYCVKTGSVLALRCLHGSALSEKQAGGYVTESEVNGSTPITDWNINLEGMLDNANWLDVELRESQKSETEPTSSITTEHISCKFSHDLISHDGTVLENEGISFEESDNVLNLLMSQAKSGMGQE